MNKAIIFKLFNLYKIQNTLLDYAKSSKHSYLSIINIKNALYANNICENKHAFFIKLLLDYGDLAEYDNGDFTIFGYINTTDLFISEEWYDTYCACLQYICKKKRGKYKYHDGSHSFGWGEPYLENQYDKTRIYFGDINFSDPDYSQL